jgi:hypothetical protein
MIIILWAFGIFLLQSRYDSGPQAETRSTAEQKGHPFPPTVRLGRRLATSIISASHASVNDESEARRRRPGSGRPDDATANTLVLQDGRIRIQTLVYTVQAEYVHVLQSWERSGKRVRPRRRLTAFYRLSSVKSPIMSDR